MGPVAATALLTGAVKAGKGAYTAYQVVHAPKRIQKEVQRKLHPKKKEEITMRKSGFVAVIVFLAAAVGALLAAYMYLQRREKELDEYEKLLFGEEYDTDNTAYAPEDTAEDSTSTAE